MNDSIVRRAACVTVLVLLIGCGTDSGAGVVREFAAGARLQVPVSSAGEPLLAGGGEIAVLRVGSGELAHLALDRPSTQRSEPVVRPQPWSDEGEVVEIPEGEEPPAPRPSVRPTMITLLGSGGQVEFGIEHSLGERVDGVVGQPLDPGTLTAELQRVREASPAGVQDPARPWSLRETLRIHAMDGVDVASVVTAWSAALAAGYSAPQFQHFEPKGSPHRKVLETLPDVLGWEPVDIAGARAFDGELLLLVDRSLSYGVLAELMFECADAGIWRLAVVVDRPDGLGKLRIPLGTER